ncbi:serine hydrolase domain-containing protein [Nocardiopsis potens]|uniref:serine hydrolase domain-containing protein n=1 Tax=Nocardiopsis potens TaxID=1246458 RepID=UPI0003486819|nr:serine hydrolase domain-containing protein [Nocardiopsis potens]
MRRPLDPEELEDALAAVHRAGMPGVFAEVRDGERVWRGAAGFADAEAGRPAEPGMRHRVGSITKAFTAAAVLRQAERGRFGLDDPIGRHLPHLVPGERGEAITVRMLLDHTSGLPDYIPCAFPSLKGFPAPARMRPESLGHNRFRRFGADELIGMGVAAPAAGAPGGTPGAYSNTNYRLLGRLLERVTGDTAEECITRDAIEPAGLGDTAFPASPRIEGPHPRMYESWFGLLDPPRDHSVYDMSWVGPAAALVSTTADLNAFFRALLAGKIVSRSSLEQMQRTVPVVSFEGKTIDYGLGLKRSLLPGGGTAWGHDGTVWGAGAVSMISADGERQMSVAVNLMRWNRLDADGRPLPHPLDGALEDLYRRAMGGTPAPAGEAEGR